MNWLQIIFAFMAIVTFFNFGAHARRRDGHKMAFAFVVLIVWTVLIWWAGT